MTMSEADQFSRKITKSSTTFAFRTQSDIPVSHVNILECCQIRNLCMQIGASITIILPANYFIAIANPAARLQSPQPVPAVSCALVNAQTSTITCITAGKVLFADEIQLIIEAGQLKTGAATTQDFLFVESTNQLRSVYVGNMLAIKQGRVFDAKMQISSSDLFSRKTNQQNVNFFFATVGELSAGSSITVSLPSLFFTGKLNPLVSLIALNGGDVPAVSCQLANANLLTIVCKTSQITLLSGSYRLMVPPGQLTLGSVVPETSGGLTIESTEDLPSIGTRTPRVLVPRIMSVQMTLSQRDAFTNRTTSDIVMFSFSMESDLQVGGTISIALPSYYFVAKAKPLASLSCASCPSTEIPNVQCLMEGKTLAIVCTTSNFNLRSGLVKLSFPAGEFSTSDMGGVFKTSGVRIAASDHVTSAMIEAPSIFCVPGQGISKDGNCRPCPPGEFSSGPSTRPCELCPTTAYNPSASSTACIPCGSGRSTGYIGAIAQNECTCNDGLYVQEGKCVPCLRGGLCSNSRMSSSEKFWSDATNPSAKPIACGFCPDACFASSKCTDGHFGFLCSECQSGYFSVGGQCKPCNERNNITNILIIVFFNISLLFMIVLTIKGSSASINAFIQMLQIETLAMYIDTSKPNTVQSALTALSVFSLNPELVMLECRMGVGDGPGDRQSSMIFNFQVFIAGCLIATYSLIGLGALFMMSHFSFQRQRASLAKIGKELPFISKRMAGFVTLTMHQLFACGLFIGAYVFLPVTVSSFEHIWCINDSGFSFVKVQLVLHQK